MHNLDFERTQEPPMATRPTTAAEARALGLTRYWPVEACRNGHEGAWRNVNNGACNACKNEAAERFHARRRGEDAPIRARRDGPTGTLPMPVAQPAPPILTISAPPLRMRGDIVARAVGRYVAQGDGMALQLTENCNKAVYALTVEEEVMYLGVTQSDLKVRTRYYAKPEKDKAESLTYTNWKIHRLIRAEIEAGHEVLLRVIDVPWATFQGLDYWPGVGIEHALIDEMCPPWNGESNQATRKMRRAARLQEAQRSGG
ncbi:hypothetical protein QTI24_28170 [Variovorax sp. J22P240]|uniref:hypothetical protein n=1 Tax=Variovorax sp. J22P240 TaxID=3053514 RepID=UPI002575DC2D|nr:hypothetical protein [Variovorax sp. J22P240]MDM0002510.1 hypothetical protein [Variovorax sp. J22P240]